MKEKDIISDYKQQKYVFYVEKDDGTYGTREGGSYLIENDLDDFWHKKTHLEHSLRQRLMNNEINIIYYYMVLEDLTPSELALRAGISKAKVKKHLNPEKSDTISLKYLRLYADVFNIPLANLFQIIVSASGSNRNYHFFHEKDKNNDPFVVRQTSSKNPDLVITKAEENTK